MPRRRREGFDSHYLRKQVMSTDDRLETYSSRPSPFSLPLHSILNTPEKESERHPDRAPTYK
jgi:hypothetical protein